MTAPLPRRLEVADGELRMNDRVCSRPGRCWEWFAWPHRARLCPAASPEGMAATSTTICMGQAPGCSPGSPARWDVRGRRHARGDGRWRDLLQGVEIAGDVDIRFDLLKGRPATWLVTELRDRWVPHATADTYQGTLALVCEEASELLVDQWGFTIEDAFIFLSMACDAGVAQPKPAPGGFGAIARFSIPKISAPPGPFAPLR